MSLKIFHVFFILCSAAVSVWIGLFQWGQGGSFGPFSSKFMACLFLALAAVLLVYFVWFLIKTRNLGPSA